MASTVYETEISSGEEQSDPAGRLSRLATSPLDFALAATPRVLVLQREPAPRLESVRFSIFPFSWTKLLFY